jgi:D-arabinose 1-dehydrogenase-like Zn-dependent alcohol dehydrogenase
MANQTPSYRALQVTEPGKLKMVTLPTPEVPRGRVRILVEACGICHTDAATIYGMMPGLVLPRVPGHEVVGRIDAVGDDVSEWKVGQRVGVGYLGGHCGTCPACRRGDFVVCSNQPVCGVHFDGGYGELMIGIPSGLVSIPDELSAVEAAPLLCAGLTTYNALRRSPAKAGDLVAIQGVGGLGHLAVQYAVKMGFRVAAIARGEEKEPLAKKLGAHHYIDSKVGDPAESITALGGAQVILATASDSKSISSLVGGLAPRGRLVIVGAGADPLAINPLQLLFGSRSIEGSLTGSAIDNEDTLAFSILANIRAMVETVSLEKAAEAFAKMERGEARFRMVIDMGAKI